MRGSYSHLEDYCALDSPWIGMLVGILDSWNILEVQDVAHLVCTMFLRASSRMYIPYLYITERGAHTILSKRAVFLPNILYLCSVLWNI
jgi:hypothetical protein